MQKNRREFITNMSVIGLSLAINGCNAAKPTEQKTLPTPIVRNELAHIVNLPLFSEQRIKEELNFAKNAQTLAEIENGFVALASVNARKILVDNVYSLRERNERGLSNELLGWINRYTYDFENKLRIHPESLACALETYDYARQDIEVAVSKGLIRRELGKTFNPNHLMINPFGMAVLVCTETGRNFGDGIVYPFTYIGSERAISQYNPQDRKQQQALMKVVNEVSDQTRLPFRTDNIPASEGAPAVGHWGGAIGLQFMPETALEIMEDLKKIGVRFNPFERRTALRGAWFYLAKYGYTRGNEKQIINAISMWNNDTKQVSDIFEAAVDYHQKFLRD